jgi:hypothetical protein
MSSKFLTTSNDNNLANGTAEINILTATIQSLAPSLPVRTSGSRQLTSGLIQTGDCNFAPMVAQFSMAPILGGPVITNSVVKTSLLGAGRGSLNLPAFWLGAGSVGQFRSNLSIPSWVSGTITFVLELDGSTIWQYTSNAAPQTGASFKIDVDIINSDTASCYTFGTSFLSTGTPVQTISAGAWATGAPHVLDFTAQWSAADVGNQVQAFSVYLTRVF